jgi:hypothetical protein
MSLANLITALIVYIVVPGGEYKAYIPMDSWRSCRNAEAGFNAFPNEEQMSMAAYCQEIK